jgi:hypothetical protein
MRGGEGVGLPGYDGIVEAARATSFVPYGLSVWEMGTSEDAAGKATEDYDTRTADPLAAGSCGPATAGESEPDPV